MAIQIADGFQLKVAKPLDDRQNVETIAQLDPTYGYEGQIVYVKDIKQFYTCYKDENGSLAYKVMETGSSIPNESAGIELWVSGESYEENDFVSYNDYIYRCKIANNDADFVEDNWQKQSDTHVEITEQEILDLLGLTDEELETMAQLIDDSIISLNKTYSSSKIHADIRQCLQDSKDFTLGELSKKIGASYKVVSSTSEMTSKDYLYLLSNGSSYDIYIVEEDSSATKIGNTTIDLSNYYTKSEVDNDFLKKVDADGKYATITTVDGKVDKTDIESELGTETLDTTSQTVKGAINELSQSVPTKTSQLTNDSNYQTAKQVNSAITTEIAKVETELKGNIKELSSNLGDLTKLKTKEKSNVVGAVNEVANCVGVIITNPDDLDLNNYKTNGGYTFGNWKNYANAPFNTTNGTMLVEDTGTYKTQIAIHRSTGVVKTRLFADGVWTPWVELATIDKVEADLTDINTKLAQLETQSNELFQSVSNGKTSVANAITGKGVSTSSTATFATMATNIGKISGGYKEETKSYTITSSGTATITLTFSANVLGIKQIIVPTESSRVTPQTTLEMFKIEGKNVTIAILSGSGTWKVTALIEK